MIDINSTFYYSENEGTAKTFRDISTNYWYYENELISIIGIEQVEKIKNRFKKKQIMEIWLIHTTNFSARMIHLGMKLYCLLRGKKVPEVIYNHALALNKIEVGIKFDDSIWEADFPQVKRISYIAWRRKKKNQNMKMTRVDLQLTPEQEKVMYKYLINQEGKSYETVNFWWHLVKIFTGKWYGKRNDNQHYCYELILWALNLATGSNYDVYMNPIEFAETFKVYE